MPARWMILIKNKEWGRKMDWEGMEGRGKEKKKREASSIGFAVMANIFADDGIANNGGLVKAPKLDHPLNYY